MATVNAVPREKVSDDVKAVYDNLSKTFGRVPNIFGVMAHHSGALEAFLPLYGAVMDEGTLGMKFKELAYLKTSLLNGCEY